MEIKKENNFFMFLLNYTFSVFITLLTFAFVCVLAIIEKIKKYD